jgi:RNA polymerase sigma factor (sigma-70 family)
MSRTPAQFVVDRLRQAGEVEKASDSDLLDVFLGQRNESAFAELVRRHGPMVWGVCWRMLSRRVDAEDCYQATFLVLLRKAHTVRPRARVGAWLHGVAYHTALKARHLAAKRGHMELQVERLPEPISKADTNADLRQVLDRGLSELPEKYRTPIVLCELEGRTLKEVALELGCPLGTLAGRLARGRDLLARRLVKHGAPAGAVAIAVCLSSDTSSTPLPASSGARMAATIGGAPRLAALGLSASPPSSSARRINPGFITLLMKDQSSSRKGASGREITMTTLLNCLSSGKARWKICWPLRVGASCGRKPNSRSWATFSQGGAVQ